MAATHTSDGIELHGSDWGAEGLAVVLLHAWGLTSHMWNSQIIPLTDQGYRVITVDRRGHGRSGFTAGGYDLDTLASDIVTVADGLNLHELVLVGHSMGSLEAVRAATFLGARVRGSSGPGRAARAGPA